MPSLLVLRHHPATGPSRLTPTLDEHAGVVPWRLLDVTDQPLPGDDEPLAGVLVMGGPMSAVHPQRHPWMPEELDFLRRRVADGVPVLGICLGAQLLGTALGGRVSPRTVPEAGYLPLRRTAAGRTDPVLGAWPDGAAPLLLHEDEVDRLPPAARPLLTGNDGVPAWRHGSALAIQFHPEVDVTQLRGWADLLEGLLSRAGSDVEGLLREARHRESETVSLGRDLLARWLDVEVRPRLLAPSPTPRAMP
ncbi:type 1 glutamine amidotransferase [Egicoccus sp. AB-alg2]|uniref:type 1 glutamine amidotransferase n=1 Tax=Egicoccus sp. AB-alg2 TaxID=3242693 RepID=UPI00359CE9F5